MGYFGNGKVNDFFMGNAKIEVMMHSMENFHLTKWVR